MNRPTAPPIGLRHLDNLWLQVSGTLCNLACTHCFNNSGPNVRTFEHMSLDAVAETIAAAVRRGVREVFFTGGEPFLNPDVPEMLALALAHAPATVLTNGTLIGDPLAERLGALAGASRYSLEIRVSLDGYTEPANDAIRGAGVFARALAAIVRLSRHELLPLVTIVKTWPDEDDLDTLAGFARLLRDAGYARPRIKVIPAVPLGRELLRVQHQSEDTLVTPDMLDGFDVDLLMCSNSRIVTDRGVWVCPLLVNAPDARLGSSLDDAIESYPLRHHACVTCWRYGTICGNVSAQIEGPDRTRRQT
jgi:AdoMet-dependent heme synthase